MVHHFNETKYSFDDFTITVIEKIYKEDTLCCQAKESHWIQMLQSLAPDGLNLEG